MFDAGLYIKVINFLKKENRLVSLKGHCIEFSTNQNKKVSVRIAQPDDYCGHNYFMQVSGEPFFWIGDSLEEFKKDIEVIFLIGGN